MRTLPGATRYALHSASVYRMMHKNQKLFHWQIVTLLAAQSESVFDSVIGLSFREGKKVVWRKKPQVSSANPTD